MAARTVICNDNREEFVEFVKTYGYVEISTKGEYEALRFINEDTGEKLIYYFRDMIKFYTCDNSGSSYELSYLFSQRHTGDPLENPKKWIAIDFDATITSYTGWRGKGILDDPLPGAVDCINKIYKSGLGVIINTTRLEVDKIKEYLKKQNIPYHHVNYSPLTTELDLHPNKVMAHVYLDDRSVEFNGEWSESLVDRIINFKTYWEKAREDRVGERVVGQRTLDKELPWED